MTFLKLNQNQFCYYRHHEKNEAGKKGEKGHKFNEEGRFHKGHSIKGKHVLHNLDESGKKHKYFDEDYDGAFNDEHGKFHENKGAKKGGSHKKGHHHKAEESDAAGKKGHGQKGHHDKEEKGKCDDKKEKRYTGSQIVNMNLNRLESGKWT